MKFQKISNETQGRALQGSGRERDSRCLNFLFFQNFSGNLLFVGIQAFKVSADFLCAPFLVFIKGDIDGGYPEGKALKGSPLVLMPDLKRDFLTLSKWGPGNVLNPP